MSSRVLDREKVIHGAIFLSIAGIFTKILSAAYRVPYQNIVGDIGNYIYQQVYPLYAIALVLATYGFPVSVSKIIAEKLESNKESSIPSFLTFTFILTATLCGLFFISLYLGATEIALFMGDSGLTFPIQIASISYLLIPFLTILRGYHQGYNHMLPTAISQMGEQLIRVLAILAFSYVLISRGYSPYIAGAGALFGSVLGALVALVLLLFFTKPITRYSLKWKVNYKDSLKDIKKLFYEASLISVSSLALIFFQLGDAFSVYNLLVINGTEEQVAKITKGIYDRGQPLIQLGTVLATTFTLPLVPLIASARATHNTVYIKNLTELTYKITIVVGSASAVGLAILIRPINIMLFENASGSAALMILAISILFSSLVITSAALLQGLDNTSLPALHVLYGFIIKILGNLILVPLFSIKGAATSTLIAVISVAFLNFLSLHRRVKIKISKNFWVAILLSLTCMSILLFGFRYGWSMLGLLEGRIEKTAEALISVTLGATIYIYFILKMHAFTVIEIESVPLLNKVYKKTIGR